MEMEESKNQWQQKAKFKRIKNILKTKKKS